MKNTIGNIIKKQRKIRKITQEQLCEGICDPSWISKIESGTRMPESIIAEALLKRLGLEPHQYINYIAEEELEISNLKHQIRRYYSSGYEEEAKKDFLRLKQIFCEKEIHKLNRQFMILYELFLEKKHESARYKLERLMEAFHITRTDFDVAKIKDYLLSDEEIVLINNVAIQRYELSEKQEAKDMVIQLKEYVEQTPMDFESMRRIYPVLLYNLTKWQGLSGEYASCLENCEKGIRFCKEYNILSLFPYFLFNQSCALASLGVRENIKSKFHVADVIFRAIDLADIADSAKAYAQRNYRIQY